MTSVLPAHPASGFGRFALDYAFRNNVIHRDIKPANILRTADTQVKISDFGVAFIRNAAHTQTMDAGSPYYASPEQATGYWQFARKRALIGARSVCASCSATRLICLRLFH